VCWLLVEENEMFSFQQGLNGITVRLIVDSCQQFKKLRLHGVIIFFGWWCNPCYQKLGTQL